jgi:uncharacterized membrane protein YkoI
METCLQSALALVPGRPGKVEFKTERGTPTYEIEISDQAKTFELECDANTGKITEQEREVSGPDDPAFKARAKISLEQAQAIALKAHAGRIVETEYEIEHDGNGSFEFDIATPGGDEVKIEVDAATGRIVEDDEREIYQIGGD